MNSSYQTYLYSSILDSKSDILCTTSKPSYYNLKPFTMPPFNNNSIPTNINGYPQTSFYNMCQYFDNLLSNLNESNDGADIKLNIANTTNNYVLNSHNSEINLYKPLSTDLLKKDKHSNIKNNYAYPTLITNNQIRNDILKEISTIVKPSNTTHSEYPYSADYLLQKHDNDQAKNLTKPNPGEESIRSPHVNESNTSLFSLSSSKYSPQSHQWSPINDISLQNTSSIANVHNLSVSVSSPELLMSSRLFNAFREDCCCDSDFASSYCKSSSHVNPSDEPLFINTTKVSAFTGPDSEIFSTSISTASFVAKIYDPFHGESTEPLLFNSPSATHVFPNTLVTPFFENLPMIPLATESSSSVQSVDRVSNHKDIRIHSNNTPERIPLLKKFKRSGGAFIGTENSASTNSHKKLCRNKFRPSRDLHKMTTSAIPSPRLWIKIKLPKNKLFPGTNMEYY